AHGFGDLVKNSRGIVQFGLTPMRQQAVGNFFYKGPFNFVRRVAADGPVALPGILVLVGTIMWANNEFEARKRKNPADYANDQ
ncbi:uncharacterized protein MONBRDRAFT_20994, partial [Monosiga brevicollis MX1]